MKSVRVVVTGRVQGVWYRAWTEKTASGLGLAGWVRNRADGSVEAVFSGPDENVDKMVVACGEGPPLARVDGVSAEECPPPDGEGFVIRPTA